MNSAAASSSRPRLARIGAQGVVSFGVAGFESDSLLERRECLDRQTRLGQGNAQIDQRGDMIRRLAEPFLILSDRIVELPLHGQRGPQAGLGLGTPGLEADRFPQGRYGLVKLALTEQRAPRLKYASALPGWMSSTLRYMATASS